MQRLKIYIDHQIKKKFANETYWTLRLLLSGIGYCWEEVDLRDSKCDIAYVTSFDKPIKAKVKIKANLDYWHKKADLRLKAVKNYNGLIFPIYEDKLCTHGFSLNNGSLICNNDIIFDVFWFVTGQEEKHWPKDRHGFFDLSGSPYLNDKILFQASASAIGIWLEKEILKLFPSIPVIPRWPNGKKAATCVSHDVDYPEVKRFIEPLRIIGRQGLSGLRPAISVLRGTKNHWNFPSWVQMEKKYGVRSAFYFTAWKGSLIKYISGTPDPFYDIRSERFKQLFEYLTDEGIEIGLHASYLAFIDQKRFDYEKRILEQYAGQEIHGNRHHYWHLNPYDVESTLMLHEQVGLKYDTSLAHEKYIGWRRSISWPFFPFHQKERRELKTLQVQTTWMDDHLFGYYKYNNGNRMDNLQALIDKAAEQGGCLLVDVHDYVFDDDLFPEWRKTYLWFIENVINHSDFWVCTPGEIADHWMKRFTHILSLSNGLKEGY